MVNIGKQGGATECRYRFNKNKAKSVLRFWVFVVLISSWFDTVSRFLEDLSFFRVLSLLTTTIIMLKHEKEYTKYNILMMIVGLYSILMIMLWGGSYKWFINIYIHWLFVYSIFIHVKYLSNEENFEENFFVLIDRITIICISIFYVEYFTGIRFFESMLAKYELPSSVFFGINDFVTAILPVGVLYISKFVYDKKVQYLLKYIVVFISIGIIRARSGLVCMIFSVIIIVILRLVKKEQFWNKVFTFSFLVALAIAVISCINPTFRDTKFRDLIFSSLGRIIRMEITNSAASLDVRGDAVIVGIKTFFNSYGFGVGIGGSTNILSNYGFLTLKSMHNMLMELIVDLGWLAILFFIYMAIKVLNCYRVRSQEKISNYALVFVLLTPLFAVQSSGGMLSIYAFWITYFYVFICCFNSIEKNKFN